MEAVMPKNPTPKELPIELSKLKKKLKDLPENRLSNLLKGFKNAKDLMKSSSLKIEVEDGNYQLNIEGLKFNLYKRQVFELFNIPPFTDEDLQRYYDEIDAKAAERILNN